MIGIFALVAAVAVAGYILVRTGRGGRFGGDQRMMTLLKGVAFLGLAAVLFVAKLWPLAFMVLIAAGGVTAIELWRDRAIKADEAATSLARTAKPRMAPEEAASVLGVPLDADIEAIKAAHKKLISQLHPDKGGTDYLAAKINEAREILTARAAASAPPRERA